MAKIKTDEPISEKLSKNTKLSKKVDNLRGLSATIYKLLCHNPTTKYAVENSGKSKFSVVKTINKLIEKGYLERVTRGLYKVVQNKRVLTRVVQNQKNHLNTDLEKTDTLRLHNLEIELLISGDMHQLVRSLVFKRKVFKNIREAGNNGGYYFDSGIMTYMVTKKRLFAIFPENWQVEADTVPKLSSLLYDAIRKEIELLQSRYKIQCFKEGRVNFNIRKIHIALVKNGVAEEFKKDNINNLVIKDEIDGKPRFIMDMSKGLHELEAVHAEYSLDDAEEAKYFMHKLKDGEVRTTLDKNKEFFNMDNISMKEIVSALEVSAKTHQASSQNTEEVSKLLLQIVKILEIQTLKTIQPEQKPEEPKDRPSYIN
jgi:hypothetical protein